MRRLMWLLLIPLWIGSTQPAYPLNAAPDSIPCPAGQEQAVLLVLGDSLSAAYNLEQAQGWVSLLQNALQHQGVRVVNAAISGDTTRGGLARLPRLLDTHQPTHVLIELGGNDGLQGYPIAQMRDNLSQMIRLVQQAGATPLLQQMQIPTNYGKRYSQLFSNTFTTLAEQHKVPLIPFMLAEIALDPALMQSDGIHPKAAAQPLIKDFILEQLQPYLPTSE